ncbi:MAG: hypothetical protein KF797_00290 [Flavobacteriales bacterium]|nr:hypothetical protein [Flavobacteriales bacterium]
MRLLARSLLFLIGTLVLIWLLRGPLFRAVVHYRVVGTRAPAVVPKSAGGTVEDLEAAIGAALDTTAARLHFSTGSVSNDPARLGPGSPANCIGYAALFASLLKGYLAAMDSEGRYAVEPIVGQLHIGGWNLHDVFSGPFWKDHDIVRITDRVSGAHTYIDPTLYDAVGIGCVRGQGQ